MSFPLKLPYYASHIPHSLPNRSEIESGASTSDWKGQRVVNVGHRFIVKYGPQVSAIEGENMIYVKQNTRVAVPQVYAIYKDADPDCTYIVMECIQGETLQSAWSGLCSAQKNQIALTLRKHLLELRALPSPGYFGSIGKRALLESMFWTPEGLPSISGPFDSEAELNEGMAQKYVHFGAPPFKADFCRRAFPVVLSGHPAVFTHADFQRKNTMINFLPNDAICVTLIDWEKSGWLPSYWEYSMAMLSGPWDDWKEWLDTILEPYYSEYPYLQMLHFELWS